MLTNNQPLLYTATSKSSHQKALCLLLSVVVILSSSALIAVHLIRTSSVNLYQENICQKAQDQTSCFAHVSEIIPDGSMHFENNQGKLIEVFLKNSLVRTRNAIEVAKNAGNKINDAREQAALADCATLMEMSGDRMQDSVVRLQKLGAESQADVHTWLSSVLTNYITCSDGLAGSASTSVLKPLLDDLTSRAKTSLALFVAAYPPEDSHTNFIQQLVSELPSWVSSGDRRLLQAGVAGSVVEAIAADVVVAKDGSGKYKTVKEAVASAPDKGTKRYVIYVKKGTYKENVEIGKAKTNVMLVGDGMDQTIITGSLNVVDGATTFNSATVAVNGDGFMAQDIWFQNTAGAAKHQAVAVRVSADKSVINRCKIDAYQDTLYTHTNRQFYRDSYITGTVDFIFGNAGVVFQNCKIVARKPMSNQSNMVTAQGRTDPNQNTGTSIQNCNVIASSDLEPVKGSIKSYLGRPWKEYSRTVVMQSYIGDHVDPAGWSVWSGDFALKTLYYGEYLNQGPGAGTSKRVTWAGYHVITSAAEAQKFTVAELIQGGVWLKSTGVTYTEGL